MKYNNFKVNTVLVGIICMLVAFVVIVKIHTYFYQTAYVRVEGFTDTQKYVLKTNIDLYDNFYASIYDELVYSNIKNEFEIGKLVESTNPTSESVILDIGSGTGHIVSELSAHGFKNVVGIDKSRDMISAAVAKYPKAKFYVADIMNISGFPLKPATYTHILCLYFTFYYMSDKKQFLQNCYTLLKPGGYLLLHLVDRNQFDPILPPGNPFYILSPQNYSSNRITNTKIAFNGFDYTANFNIDKPSNIAIFEESFKDTKTNNVRVNKHTLYMESIPTIMAIIKQTRFIIKERIDMIECAYDYQYLYVLYKSA